MKCRKNVKNLSPGEKKKFVSAVLALKSQNSVIHPGTQSRYDDFVEVHLNAMMVTPGWAHDDSVFFPWHRELLYQFEKLLQAVDPDVTIPYWDWTRDQSSATSGFPFKHDLIGVDGTDADGDRVKRDPAAPPVDATHPYIYPFDPEAWSSTVAVTDPADTLNYFQRQFGERFDAPGLPQNDVVVTGTGTTFRAAIDGAINFVTHRTRSEDLHNLVHRWVGGNMLRMTSPNDPVFFMHHASIDRMWSIWQRKVAPGTALFVASSNAAGHKLNDPMIFNDVDPPPFTTTASPADVIDGHAMHGDGVWYASDIPELNNETGATLSFVDIPEGLTSYKAVKFRIKGCRPVHFRITGAPTGNFGLTTMGTEFVATPDDATDFYFGYVWVALTAVAGPIAASGVGIHAYIVDEEGYYAATEGGEYPLGDFHVDLTATTVARQNNAVALVLDRSGSMNDPAGGTSTKHDLLVSAIQVFRDLMLANAEIAVITFDDVVDTPIVTQAVSAAPAFSTVDLTPRNWTWIGGGIQQGAAQLAVATHTNKSMIVLTDGNENVHPYIGEIDPGLLTNRTYAIGFGLPGGVSDAALNQITQNTHGDLIITGNISTDEQRFNLTKYFVQLLAGVTNMDVLLDPQGSLFLGSKHIIPFDLSDSDVYADVITLTPTPKLIDFQLETPDGTIIKPSTPAPNIRYVNGQQVCYYRVALPALATNVAGTHAGTWRAILAIKRGASAVDGADLVGGFPTAAARGSIPYSFVVHAYSNLRLNAYKQQESFRPGTMVRVFATLQEYDVPLRTDASVWVEVTRPDGSTVDLDMVRDNSATYLTSFYATVAGVYFCRVRAQGLSSKGSRFIREKTLSAGAYYGNYDPVPQPSSGEDFCRLVACLLSDKTFSPELVRRLAQSGVDLDHVRKCIREVCREQQPERPSGAPSRTRAQARKERAQTPKAIKLKRATPAKPLKQPTRVVPQPIGKRQPQAASHFPQLVPEPSKGARRAQDASSHFPQLIHPRSKRTNRK